MISHVLYVQLSIKTLSSISLMYWCFGLVSFLSTEKQYPLFPFE